MNKKIPPKKLLAKKTWLALRKVRKKQASLGNYKLPTPRQKGWRVATYVRADILLSSQADVYKRILPHIAAANYHVSRKQDDFIAEEFKVRHFQSRYGKRSDPTYWSVIPFSSIPEWRKDKIDFPEFYWTKYFSRVRDESTSFLNVDRWKYVLKSQYHRCFGMKVVPNMIHSIPIIDPDLESQESYFEAKMEQNDYWKHVFNQNDDSYQYEGYMKGQRELEREFHKEIREELAKKSA